MICWPIGLSLSVDRILKPSRSAEPGSLKRKCRIMWYFVVKNGKAIKAYKSEWRAIDFAKTKVAFDSLKDRLLVVTEAGDILLDW